jgi:hypothetical protein
VLWAREQWRQRTPPGRTGQDCRCEHDRDTADDHLDAPDFEELAHAVEFLTQGPGQAYAPELPFVLSFDLADLLLNHLLLARQVIVEHSTLMISSEACGLLILGRLPRHSIVVCPGNRRSRPQSDRRVRAAAD